MIISKKIQVHFFELLSVEPAMNLRYYWSDEEVRISMLEQRLERMIIKFGLTAFGSDASGAKLLEFAENFEAWMWKEIIVWTSGIPIGHSFLFFSFPWRRENKRLSVNGPPNNYAIFSKLMQLLNCKRLWTC